MYFISKNFGPVPFSAQYLICRLEQTDGRTDGQTDRQTDRQTDELIPVGLGNLRRKSNISSWQYLLMSGSKNCLCRDPLRMRGST